MKKWSQYFDVSKKTQSPWLSWTAPLPAKQAQGLLSTTRLHSIGINSHQTALSLPRSHRLAFKEVTALLRKLFFFFLPLTKSKGPFWKLRCPVTALWNHSTHENFVWPYIHVGFVLRIATKLSSRQTVKPKVWLFLVVTWNCYLSLLFCGVCTLAHYIYVSEKGEFHIDKLMEIMTWLFSTPGR